MSEFKVIETQEQFDAAIKDRLARAKEKAAEEERAKYSDYDNLKSQVSAFEEKENGYASQISDLNSKITELNSKITGYQTDEIKRKIMTEMKIPAELKGYVTGATEEEMKASASALAPFLKVSGGDPSRNPGASDPVLGNSVRAGLKELLN